MLTPTHIVVHDFERQQFAKISGHPFGSGYFKSDDGTIYNASFVFPIELESRVMEVMQTRAAQRKAFDDGMSLIFQLCNERSLLGQKKGQ